MKSIGDRNLGSIPKSSPRSSRATWIVAVSVMALVLTGVGWWYMRAAGADASLNGPAVAIETPKKTQKASATSPPPVQPSEKPKAPVAEEPLTLESDPVRHFKEFAAGFVLFGKEVSNQPKQDRKEVWTWKSGEEYAVNVTRTDSLVSPYIGTLQSRISYLNIAAPLRITDSDVTITFAGQDGKWVYKGTTATYLFTGQPLDCTAIMTKWIKFLAERMPPSAIDEAKRQQR